jgi:hypothetical protein
MPSLARVRTRTGVSTEGSAVTSAVTSTAGDSTLDLPSYAVVTVGGTES